MTLDETPLENWTAVQPVRKPSSKMALFCPFCDEELEKYSGDYPDYCKCGRWHPEDRIFYRTKMNEAEAATAKRLQKEKAEKRKSAQAKRELAIYERVKQQMEKDQDKLPTPSPAPTAPPPRDTQEIIKTS